MHSKHCQTRSYRLGIGRKTSPMPLWRPPPCRHSYPAKVKPLQGVHHPRSNWDRNLHRASFLRMPQKQAVRLSSDRSSPAWTQEVPIESFSEKTPLGQLGLEERPEKLQQEDPPPTQLDMYKLELEHKMLQLERAMAQMHQAVHSLDAKLAKAKASKQEDNKQQQQ